MKKLIKFILILFSTLFLFGCYSSDYQASVEQEFPGAKVFYVDQNTDIFVVIAKDSAVYYVKCNRFLSTKPSTKQFLFNLKKPF